jgi:hypothetical protein
VLLSDSTCEVSKNTSGVKVTVVETGSTIYADSTGHYEFTGLSSGNYDFRLDYENYPEFYWQDVVLTGINGTVIRANDGVVLSPKATHTFVLDSAIYTLTYSTNNVNPDTTLTLYFRRFNSFPIRYSNHLCIISKSQSNLDYLSGKYDKLVYADYSSLFYRTIDTLWEGFQYDSLKVWGFKSGDSLCIKYYALNSTSFYVDRSTGRMVFSSLGNGSNVYATKLK